MLSDGGVPCKTYSGAKLALKKDKVKRHNFGQVALLQVFILLEEACDGMFKKPTAPGHIADTRINSMARG